MYVAILVGGVGVFVINMSDRVSVVAVGVVVVAVCCYVDGRVASVVGGVDALGVVVVGVVVATSGYVGAISCTVVYAVLFCCWYHWCCCMLMVRTVGFLVLALVLLSVLSYALLVLQRVCYGVCCCV